MRALEHMDTSRTHPQQAREAVTLTERMSRLRRAAESRIQRPVREEIRSGVFRLVLPLPGHGVGHVNVYCFVADEGILLIDTGWAIEACEQMLIDELRGLGLGLEHVATVLATHLHVDHCGLAGLISERSGGWVGMHPLDAERLVPRYFDTEMYALETRTWLEEAGIPPALAGSAIDQIDVSSRRTVRLKPDRLLVDGDIVAHGPWSFLVLHTPGHTPGHLCFYEQTERLMFSGDHVLPYINTSATYRPQSHGDPLGSYLASLEHLARLDIEMGCPGHQAPFADFARRLSHLTAYHERRLRETRELLASGSSTVWEVASQVHRSRPWSSLRAVAKFSACGESHAHLRYLERAGWVRSNDDRPIRWVTA